MEAIRSSETSVQSTSTRRHTPEDGILHSHRRENLKSYNICIFLQEIVASMEGKMLNVLIKYLSKGRTHLGD
jgi:hypothetical protein